MGSMEDLTKLGLNRWVRTLRTVHSSLPNTVVKDMPDVKFTMFWSGIHSQWYLEAPFRVTVPYRYLNGKVSAQFNCAEQFMMWAKARVFDDDDAARAIMATLVPKEQKKLGRGVKNFDEDRWNNIAKDVVLIANIAKYSQSGHLGYEIDKGRGTVFVEASPYDKVWGIGMQDSEPGVQDPSNWKGNNWLGVTVTEVCEILSNVHLVKDILEEIENSETSTEI